MSTLNLLPNSPQRELLPTMCHIQMILSSYSNDRLSIRIERGTRPRLKCSEDKKKVQITVPMDTQQNWPQVKSELFGGYYVVLQRLVGQFKITVQHTNERKPEFVVYSSALTHEKDVKTHVKEMNTQLAEVGIAGPNLDCSGVLRAQKLTLESTVGTMHLYAKIESERLRLHAQNMVIASEALISTNKLKMVARRIQVDGKLYPLECGSATDPMVMSVMVDAFLLHIGVDGRIGESNEREMSNLTKKSHPEQIVADGLLIQISGSLANYGKIVANEKVDLTIGGSLLSLSDGSIDSAGRGYDALKQIRGIGNADGCMPSSSTMHSAITDNNTNAVATLIESGVDKNDRARSKRITLRQSAVMKYREMKEKSARNNAREKVTLINALFTVHDWKRGAITANAIQASISKHCEDCAQFNAEQLQVTVGGNATSERDSIWHCQFVEMEISGTLTICGQIKHKTAIFNVEKEITVTEDAIISHEIFARLSAKGINCNGVWSVGETLVIDVRENAAFGVDCYIEADKLEAAIGNSCSIGATWQIGCVWMLVEDTVVTTSDGKVFIEDSTTIGAHKFMCSGLWSVSDTVDMQLKDSAHFFHSSKLECRVLRLACELHCTVGGLWIVDNLQVYVRHDLITTSTGKVAVLVDGKVTVGCLRNDSLWQGEKAITIIVGTIEQSEDGTLYFKDKLDMTIHKDAPQIAGKIVCGHLTLKCLNDVHCEAFVKVNDVDINLPYMNESKFTLAGQMDVLVGSLTLKGNSELSVVDSKAKHPSPAFVLQGTLNAMSLIAPFLAVELASNSTTRLFGARSYMPSADFNVLICAGALTTGKNSSQISMGDNEISEGVICATVWSHAGQMRFQTNEVHLLAGSLLYNGRFTNVPDKHNHLTDVRMVIDDYLINDGILSAHRMTIQGDGDLENRNRIFSVESMDIRLRNFSNDDGHIESKNSLKLLAASKEWTKISGSVKAKMKLDVCAHKLDFALKSIKSIGAEQKKITFSAHTDLLISTEIIDNSREMELGCAAMKNVSIKSNLKLDKLEVLLGGKHYCDNELSKFHVLERSSVDVNTIYINGTAPLVVLVVDGVVRCHKLRVAASIHTVQLSGSGSLECNTLNIGGELLSFDLYQELCTSEIVAKNILIKKDSNLRLKLNYNPSTSISCSLLQVLGNLFIDEKLFLMPLKQGAAAGMVVSGNIIGTSTNSEISFECEHLELSGQVANFRFMEVYAKSVWRSASLELINISNIAVEAMEIDVNIRSQRCINTLINCDLASIAGSVHGEQGSSFGICTGTLNSSADFSSMDNLDLNARSQAVVLGRVTNCKNVSMDAKWLNTNASMQDCGQVRLKAWCMANGGPISADDLSVTTLGIFINGNMINCNEATILATFILSLSEGSDLFAQKSEVFSLVTCANHNLENTSKATVANSCLWIEFTTPTTEGAENFDKLDQSSARSWGSASSMIRENFKSSTMDADEIITSLKYVKDLTTARIELSTGCEFYDKLNKISDRFQHEPIGLFNMARFVDVISSARGQFNIVKTSTADRPKRKKSRSLWSETGLYRGIVQFKSTKYNRDSRCSSDTVDVGYVSRSSSEDLDNKRANSPSSSSQNSDRLVNMFDETHFTTIEERLEEADAHDITAGELNNSFRNDPELVEFEELEHELENDDEDEVVEPNDSVRTDFIVCHEERIPLPALKQKAIPVFPPRPRHNLPIVRTPSSNDLVMKKLKVKRTLSSLDLRSFGSESSLCSLDLNQLGEMGSPMQFPKSSPLHRSLIPRGSFRSPRKLLPESPLKTASQTSLSRRCL